VEPGDKRGGSPRRAKRAKSPTASCLAGEASSLVTGSNRDQTDVPRLEKRFCWPCPRPTRPREGRAPPNVAWQTPRSKAIHRVGKRSSSPPRQNELTSIRGSPLTNLTGVLFRRRRSGLAHDQLKRQLLCYWSGRWIWGRHSLQE